MVKAALTVALAVAVLAGVRDGRLLERAGLFGSCSAVEGVASDLGGWMACTSGRLSGYPSLERSSCRRGGRKGDFVYWRCPASVVTIRPAAAAPSP